ncbi:membrane protein insertion efficiency factor YidD [Phaeocystidibacter luteus]|uniref:membrane protein insertion efficiency factor YidD n=1 Tax=Phaeocystidibacter luteus TaxID=911197 RepID=UPI00293909A9|nr:membrane protein insertion efficiency factor YidD [Phaeocystidibacter luteus]
MIKAITWVLSLPLLALVFLYRYVVSPLTPPSCRHTPTCSQYMGEAIVEWGPLKGSWLGLKRLSKCHPWGTWGYDPVPKKPK